MDTHDHGPELGAEWTGHLRTMQIIAGALVLGSTLFAVSVLVSFEGASDTLELLGMIGLGFAAVAIAVSSIVPGMIGKLNEGSSTTEHMGVYQTRLIVRLAILDGAAFFNITALQMEHNFWSLGIAGLLMILMLASFPTQSKIALWLQTQKEISSLD